MKIINFKRCISYYVYLFFATLTYWAIIKYAFADITPLPYDDPPISPDINYTIWIMLYGTLYLVSFCCLLLEFIIKSLIQQRKNLQNDNQPLISLPISQKDKLIFGIYYLLFFIATIPLLHLIYVIISLYFA